jgi:FkbM family methyltransferase
LFRKLLERFSRSLVIKRRLPVNCGGHVIYVSPDAALKCLKFNLESGNSDLFFAARNYVSPGDIVWDIGANVGMFAFASADKVGEFGQVLAIEADPFLASLLQRSAQMKRSHHLNVKILCCAASDETGIAKFMIAERGRASNSLEKSGHRSQAGGVRYVQYVPTTKLDDLINDFGRPNFVKIDVEGAEAFVLRGAERILGEIRPSFYIEVGEEQNDEVTSAFKRHRYELFDGDSRDRVKIDRCRFNTLAIPAERV